MAAVNFYPGIERTEGLLDYIFISSDRSLNLLCCVFVNIKFGDDAGWWTSLKLRWAFIGVEGALIQVCLHSCIHHSPVGKTSLITRFMYDSFDNTYQVC